MTLCNENLDTASAKRRSRVRRTAVLKSKSLTEKLQVARGLHAGIVPRIELARLLRHSFAFNPDAPEFTPDHADDEDDDDDDDEGTTMDGGVVQRIKVPGMRMKVYQHAASTIHSSTTRQTLEVAPHGSALVRGAMVTAGQGAEMEVAAQTVQMESSFTVAGQT